MHTVCFVLCTGFLLCRSILAANTKFPWLVSVVVRTSKANLFDSMRLCLANSITEAPSLSPESSVNEATLAIAKAMGIDPDTVYIIYKGKVLQKNNQLKYYGISGSSLLHVTCFSSSKKGIALPYHDNDEVSKKSNAIVYSEPKLASPEEECSDSDEYGEPIVASVVMHVVGDLIHDIKDSEDIRIPVDDITSFIDSDITVVKTALQTPLFQDILSDLSFVRQLLLANDTIVELTKTNPGFLEYINNDDSLKDLVNVVSDTNGYQDYRHLRQMLITKIENALGDDLHPVKEEERPIPVITLNKTHTNKKTDHCVFSHKWNMHSHGERDKGCTDRKCREEHIALLCQIVANRPDIVKAFMKKTPIYREVASKRPELLNELLKPERLKLIATPEMVRAIAKLDDCLRKYNEK